VAITNSSANFFFIKKIIIFTIGAADNFIINFIRFCNKESVTVPIIFVKRLKIILTKIIYPKLFIAIAVFFVFIIYLFNSLIRRISLFKKVVNFYSGIFEVSGFFSLL